MLRLEVLRLYRQILRSIHRVQNKDNQQYLYNWVKNEFREKKDLRDEVRFCNLIN